jgi:inward rectifier potassium channel
LINVFFAGVYMLQPGSISGSRPNSFADAFYFSVQTFATIGYGQLNPSTDFSNVVVVIEAAIGLAGVALVTGLMFTKASKPRPGILFSKPVLISPVNGIPHLMFRVGNTRGNDVISAEINVSVLRDEISAEGHHLRRISDLNLVRSRSPFFGLTWLILHQIDASSPFYGVTSSADIANRIIQLSCIFTGHDSTYGQTIYMRHVYQPSDFYVGAAFVDILGQLPDGTTVVDYAKFHDMQIDLKTDT